MWNSCSSNPLRRPEPGRRAAALAVALLACGALPACGEPVRRVITELRIAPGSTLDQPQLTAAEVRAAIEERLARSAGEKYPFLDWIPAARAAGAGGPRFVLQVADGKIGDCEPPAVRAFFAAELGGVVAWRSRETELLGICDIAAPGMSAGEFEARVAKAIEQLVGDVAALGELETRFLSQVVLATALTADPAAQTLYLPLKGLRARVDSELEVRFENRVDQRLIAHPGTVAGGRTELLIGPFICGEIEWSSAGLPRRWPPRLPELLAACRDPFVYMKTYLPNPVEIDVDSNLATEFDEEGPR